MVKCSVSGPVAGRSSFSKGELFPDDDRVLLQNPKGLHCDSPREVYQSLQTPSLSLTLQAPIGSSGSYGPSAVHLAK